jgi:hypothetical protein
MNWFKQLFSRRRLYDDLSEEIQAHLEEKIEELVASGMPRKEAAAAARREFGNVTLIEEDSREVWQWPSIKDFLMDLRFGLRMLVKNWKQASVSSTGSCFVRQLRRRRTGWLLSTQRRRRVSSTAFRIRITDTIATAIIRFPPWQLSPTEYQYAT